MPVADSVTAQSSRPYKEEEARDKSETGTVVSDISSFSDTMFDIVERGIETIEKIAPIVAMVADKPTSLSTYQHMVVLPGTDMMTTTGLDMAPKLCANQEASVGFSSGVMGDHIGNPNLYACCRTPGFLEGFIYTEATPTGTKLWEHPLSLRGMSHVDGVDITPTPLVWYASLFKFWRGSLKFFIHFVSSTFISSRVRVVWIPPGFSAPATISDNESGDYVSQVLEVTGSMDHEFTIPWVSPTLYRRTASDATVHDMFVTGSNSEGQSLGTVAMYLVAPTVTVDSSITPTVTGLVWVAGGEDLQFSNFSGSLVIDGNDTIEFAPDPAAVQAQCSINSKFDDVFPPVIDSITTVEGGIATSESYGDLVSLGKRYSVKNLFAEEANSTNYTSTFNWDQVLLQSGSAYPTLQQWLGACFTNFRGSVRFKVFWSPDVVTGHRVRITGAYDAPPVGSTFLVQCNPIFETLTNDASTFVEFSSVWNTRWPYMHRIGVTDITGLNVHAALPVTDASVLATIGSVAVSFGDDFAFGVFQAPPIIRYTVVPEAKEVQVHRNRRT